MRGNDQSVERVRVDRGRGSLKVLLFVCVHELVSFCSGCIEFLSHLLFQLLLYTNVKAASRKRPPAVVVLLSEEKTRLHQIVVALEVSKHI